MLIQAPTGAGTMLIGKSREDVETSQFNTPTGSVTGFGFVVSASQQITFPVPWAGDFWVRATTPPLLLIIIETTDASDMMQPRGIASLAPATQPIATSISGVGGGQRK